MVAVDKEDVQVRKVYIEQKQKPEEVAKPQEIQETPENHEEVDDVEQNLMSAEGESCLKVLERMATYEALSEMRSDTLPELLVIERFVDTLPERCGHIYGNEEKRATAHALLKKSIRNKISLHNGALINAIPMYKWLLQENHLVDFGANCYELGIKRAIQDGHKSGGISGTVLPIYTTKRGEIDFDYSEFMFNQLMDLEDDGIGTFSLKEYVKFSHKLADFSSFIRSNDMSTLSPESLIENMKKISSEPFKAIIVEEYDSGDLSPFEIKRFITYSINSEDGIVEDIGQGVCQYSKEISPGLLLIPVLSLFVLSVMIPIIFRLIGLIYIPDNCLDGMTYLIAPLAFIIGLAMPFVMKILFDFIGFELPQGNADLMSTLPIIILLVAIFRVSPMVGMVTVCIKANLYTEYLREKWFLFIVTIGGSLGNMTWLILGMLMEMSYSGTLISDSFRTATMNIVNQGMEGETIDYSPMTSTNQEVIQENFFEECNFGMLSHLSIFLMNSSIFLLLSVKFSMHASDIMCGRMSNKAFFAIPVTFIGSTISYGLLFFSFTHFNGVDQPKTDQKSSTLIYYWNRVSFSIAIFYIVVAQLLNCKRTKSRRAGPSEEIQGDTVPVDEEAMRYVATKSYKNMVKKLASKYGTPFVGVHRQIVSEIYQQASEKKKDEFSMYIINGRRGVGKTRLVYECFKKEQREHDFVVLQGEATVKDDDKSKDMDLQQEEHAKGSIKVQKCQPFEPIRKAIGNIVGINVFSSPAQQLSMIKGATDFADSLSGLSFLFSVDGKEDGEGNDEADDHKRMSDVHVLAESLSKILIKEAKRYQKEEGKKLVLLFEDMEYADKNSLDFIRALVKIFAAQYKSIPMIIVILYRELPGSDESENNEVRIQEIGTLCNKVAKETGGAKLMKNLVNSLLDAKKKKDNPAGDANKHIVSKSYKLDSLTEHNITQLLGALCFVEDEVPSISRWLFDKTKGKLYWVSVCLQNLFIERYVEASVRGWKIAPGKSLREIAIPNKMAQALETKFRKMEPTTLKLLQVAAECGMNFNSNLIARIVRDERFQVIYELNRIQEEHNIVTENKASSKRNDQGNDTLSGEFVFTSVVYVDAMRSMTRNYGNNLLFAKQVQLKIFDTLYENVNMSQRFLNSFFFYLGKHDFEEDQGELKFTLEQRWGNAFIEIVNFRKLPLEFKFRLAEHAKDSSLERPFEALIAFTMAALTAKDLWDIPNIVKYSSLAIQSAKTILVNEDEIDELYEWLNKIGRSGFAGEEDIQRYVKHLLSELLIIESQNLLDLSPKENSADIVQKLDTLEESMGGLPPKAKVIRALAYVYLGKLNTSRKLSRKIYEDEFTSKLYRSEACYSACFAGYNDDKEEAWKEAIEISQRGADTMLEFMKEEKKLMKSRKIRQQVKEIMGNLFMTKGMIYQFKIRNLKECRECYDDALTYKTKINDVLGMAKTNGLLGLLLYSIASDLKKRNSGEHTYSTKNDLKKAKEYYDEYYKLASKIENSEGLIEAPKGLGNCNVELGDFDEAIICYERSAQRSIEYKSLLGRVEAYCQLIKTFILKGIDDDERYKKYLDEVIRICQDNPQNEQINELRKGLMDFIEAQKVKNQRIEENKFTQFDD